MFNVPIMSSSSLVSAPKTCLIDAEYHSFLCDATLGAWID
jgi:hypothetical protein